MVIEKSPLLIHPLLHEHVLTRYVRLATARIIDYIQNSSPGRPRRSTPPLEMLTEHPIIGKFFLIMRDVEAPRLHGQDGYSRCPIGPDTSDMKLRAILDEVRKRGARKPTKHHVAVNPAYLPPETQLEAISVQDFGLQTKVLGLLLTANKWPDRYTRPYRHDRDLAWSTPAPIQEYEPSPIALVDTALPNYTVLEVMWEGPPGQGVPLGLPIEFHKVLTTSSTLEGIIGFRDLKTESGAQKYLDF